MNTQKQLSGASPRPSDSVDNFVIPSQSKANHYIRLPRRVQPEPIQSRPLHISIADQPPSLNDYFPALPAAPPVHRNTPRLRNKLFKIGLNAICLILVVGGSLVLYMSLISVNKVNVQVAALSNESSPAISSGGSSNSSSSSNEGSTTASSPDISGYQVGPGQPRYLTIKKTGVFARVLSLGINKRGEVSAPPNVHDVAWFNQSALPSATAGASLIVGHFGTVRYPTVFSRLHELVAGDEITITMGNNSIKTYAVTDKQAVNVKDINMIKYLSSPYSDRSTLYLMTCAGDYDPRHISYDQRLVVTAVEKR